MKRNILSSISACVCMLFGLVACVDDEIRPLGDIPEGETVINAIVDSKSLTSAMETRSAAGDAIKPIENLWVLAYDLDGRLLKTYTGEELLQYNTTWVEHSGKNVAETKTPRSTFQLKIPYGLYYLFAVANVDLSAPEYQEAIQTINGLKGVSFTWGTDVAKNNQMFGFFTEEDKLHDNAEPIRIDQRGMTFQAKIRRLASKVTLAFDGSKLHEGVFVYIKSAQIKDIPLSCFLGDTNRVANENDLITNGDTIQYVAAGVPYNDQYPVRITKGRAYYPHNANYEKAFHSETERALFFYENMQGKGKDKKQNPADMGKKVKGEKGYKDDKDFGTYIEVKAYYHSINPDRVGAGDITYRFMLGKDVVNDFNAERNHHYKLTLEFSNYANDVDWHIDYEEEEPGIIVPEIYYISHLYNHSMMMPVKVNAGGYELLKLEAKIDTNSWAPYQAASTDYYEALDPYKHPNTLKNYTGFLSLRKTTDKVVGGNVAADYTGDSMDKANEAYYNANKQGYREYAVNGNGTEAEGTYMVKQETSKNVWNFQVPMYTRAKQLVIPTGYTGSNPYESYRRKAVVTFTATLKVDGKEKKITKRSTILQERRLANPTGVWRKHDNAKSFHVLLQCLQSETASNFVPFTSEGKWRAYVLTGNKNFVKLNNRDTVYGSTGSNIDFNIDLNGTIGKEENRFAIVQVEYHDYSCQHQIFVRQGDEPIALLNGGTRWFTYNMRTNTQKAESPCEEGSLFRFGKKEFPIDASNNIFDNFKDNKNTEFLIAGTTDTKKTWDEIGYNSGTFTVAGTGIRVAKYEDFQALYKEGNNIENGYGVLYGDDATETQNTVESVYGYRYDKDNTYGMRGCFIYNSKDGRHIFFPIGASGYGHRKSVDDNGLAVLRYACNKRNGNFPYPTKAPLFWDLYRRPGAIYWLRQGNGDYIAWDFNYFSFDFNHIGQANLAGGEDACFVRCVVDE